MFYTCLKLLLSAENDYSVTMNKITNFSLLLNLETGQVAPSTETLSPAPQQNPEKETQTPAQIDGDLVDGPPQQTAPAPTNGSTSNGHGTVSKRYSSGYKDGAGVVQIGLAPLCSINEADFLLET